MAGKEPKVLSVNIMCGDIHLDPRFPLVEIFIKKLAKATHPEQRFQLTSNGCKVYLYPVGMILGNRVQLLPHTLLDTHDTATASGLAAWVLSLRELLS